MSLYYQDEFVSLYLGSAMEVLPTLPPDSVDALITDPPYCSGGLSSSSRMADPAKKYVQTGTKVSRPSFSGDNRDGRAWAFWCSTWLELSLRLVKDKGYALVFSDWRMLPLCTDAIQSGGFLWRGVIAWDKGESARAPHTGYYRHQCEFITWATRGAGKSAHANGPWPGCYRFPVCQSDKFHMTGKPTALMSRLVSCVPAQGTVLDPFAGSGTTLVAAKSKGLKAVGVELSEAYCEIAAKRLESHK